jgi:hypothetical protein
MKLLGRRALGSAAKALLAPRLAELGLSVLTVHVSAGLAMETRELCAAGRGARHCLGLCEARERGERVARGGGSGSSASTTHDASVIGRRRVCFFESGQALGESVRIDGVGGSCHRQGGYDQAGPDVMVVEWV